MKRTPNLDRLSRNLLLGVCLALLLTVFGGWRTFQAIGQVNQFEEPAPSDEVADINRQIEEKRKEVEDLQKQTEQYQQAADAASANVRSLKSQLTAIENQIAITDIEIQSKETEISALELEMQSVQLAIDEKEEILNGHRQQLAGALKEVERASRTPLITLLLLNQSFADFYDQAQAYASISDQLQETVQVVQGLKDELQTKQNQLADAREELDQTKLSLEVNKSSSVEQRELQSTLVNGAEQTEDEYQKLLSEALLSEQQANSAISALERQLQQKLNGGEIDPEFTSTGFIWPLRGRITAYFRDPSYPFRCTVFRHPSCLEHTGLDIGVPQGTPVRATADGLVVALANHTTSQLNYVSLFHGDGITSRYLHLSKVSVTPEALVHQGDVIGLSGGLPGTAGSGGLTTGAHLHFEMRVDGIPDDPLRYLP